MPWIKCWQEFISTCKIKQKPCFVNIKIQKILDKRLFSDYQFYHCTINIIHWPSKLTSTVTRVIHLMWITDTHQHPWQQLYSSNWELPAMPQCRTHPHQMCRGNCCWLLVSHCWKIWLHGSHSKVPEWEAQTRVWCDLHVCICV